MRISPRPDGRLLDAYGRDAELLMDRRVPLALGIFVAAIAASGLIEWRYYPQRMWVFGPFFAAQVAVCIALIVCRRFLARWQALTGAAVLAALTLGLLMIGYVTVAGSDSQLLCTGLVCLLAGTSLLLPWRLGGQIVVALAILAGFAVHLAFAPPSGLPNVYVFFGLFSGAFISVLGAHSLDRQRFAVFRESVLKDEAARETQALLRLAGELNSSLEARLVLDGIAASARDALSCDWSTILLWDERRTVFRVAASTSKRPDLADELRGMEFGSEEFPLIERLLRDEDLIVVSPAQPPDGVVAALLQRAGTRELLLATMVRAGRVVGLLAAGRTTAGAGFQAPERRLARGIAQQAAIALENARLVADLRSADRLKSEFVATMSHELRTPLNIILGYNDLLLEDAFGILQTEQRDVIERVRLNSLELLTLINATLDVNRLEAGRLPVELEDFRVDDLIAQVRSEVDRLPRPDAVALQWNVGDDATVCSDPKKLKIVLRNLITNALKFTDRGHVAVSVQRINGGGAVEFAVTDTGIGIPADELPNIFGMFRQVKAATHKSGGVGLGLYIVHRFVNQLRGDITVRSSVGTGTTFRVRIPDLGAERRAA